jgi:hypothetical protein
LTLRERGRYTRAQKEAGRSNVTFAVQPALGRSISVYQLSDPEDLLTLNTLPELEEARRICARRRGDPMRQSLTSIPVMLELLSFFVPIVPNLLPMAFFCHPEKRRSAS